jgi:hypothetical protein
VGLAVMIALIPLPAWLSARMAHMQAARMAAVRPLSPSRFVLRR